MFGSGQMIESGSREVVIKKYVTCTTTSLYGIELVGTFGLTGSIGFETRMAGIESEMEGTKSRRS